MTLSATTATSVDIMPETARAEREMVVADHPETDTKEDPDLPETEEDPQEDHPETEMSMTATGSTIEMAAEMLEETLTETAAEMAAEMLAEMAAETLVEIVGTTETGITDLATTDQEIEVMTEEEKMTLAKVAGTAIAETDLETEATPEIDAILPKINTKEEIKRIEATPKIEEFHLNPERREETSDPRANALKKDPTEAERTDPSITMRIRFLRDADHHPIELRLTTLTRSLRRFQRRLKMDMLKMLKQTEVIFNQILWLKGA